MPRKRRRLRERTALDIRPEVLEWLNGKPMDECGEYLKWAKFFFWSDYAGGLAGLISYCQENRLMPKAIPPEVKYWLTLEPDPITQPKGSYLQ